MSHFVRGKSALQKLRIIFAPAVRQRDSLTLRVERVDVVLLVLLQQLHVLSVPAEPALA